MIFGPASPWAMREMVARFTGAGMNEVHDLSFDALEELYIEARIAAPELWERIKDED